MITYTGAGWSILTIGDVTIAPSYVTDVPFDILEAAITYKHTGCASIYFDCEGSAATLIFTPWDVFMIVEEGYPELKHFNELYPTDVINELVDDIVDNKNAWVDFLVEADKDKVNKEFDRLISLVQQSENPVSMTVIDKIREEIEFNIKCNTNSEGLINLLGQGQFMTLNIIDKYVDKIENKESQQIQGKEDISEEMEL